MISCGDINNFIISASAVWLWHTISYESTPESFYINTLAHQDSCWSYEVDPARLIVWDIIEVCRQYYLSGARA